jgi:hypothetical protein
MRAASTVTREELIASGLVTPYGTPSAPYWHNDRPTLTLDPAGRRAARVHVAEGPIDRHVPREP